MGPSVDPGEDVVVRVRRESAAAVRRLVVGQLAGAGRGRTQARGAALGTGVARIANTILSLPVGHVTRRRPGERLNVQTCVDRFRAFFSHSRIRTQRI